MAKKILTSRVCSWLRFLSAERGAPMFTHTYTQEREREGEESERMNLSPLGTITTELCRRQRAAPAAEREKRIARHIPSIDRLRPFFFLSCPVLSCPVLARESFVILFFFCLFVCFCRTMSAAGAPKSLLQSSGQKSIHDICHPLSSGDCELSPSPELANPSSLGDKDLSLPNGTPVDTSSPASSSSLLNRLQLDDDLDGETRDLFIAVDDPKKHVSTMETYITYRVATKTTRTEFDLPEYSVRRRYQDFDWLRNKLEETQPTHLIPPLPEKFVVKGVVDRFSEEFVETRRKALDKFLKRIADHPVLSFSDHFNVFLTAKDLNAHKKQGLALLSKVGESVKYVTGGYKLRSRPVEFATMGEYLDTFAQKLGTIDRIGQRIIKEQSDYLVELREYGPIYSTWVGLEDELAEPLEGVSSCINNCCTALEELTEDMTEDFLPVLREYVLYTESMKNVLKKRDQVQAEYEAKLEAVALKREERPGVPTDVEKCQDRVECFNADLKADWDRWQNNKRQDFRQLLTGMADKNIQYYEKCLAAWESIIPLLQDKQEVTKGEGHL
nr:PREDICTED: sorting nexin-30 isoform X1 [Latimeria chalumnae]|eukprot:XP_005993570.1 PREDICTED: sorting nexin-30 isoform X1 [Latimeria chalumnae]